VKATYRMLLYGG